MPHRPLSALFLLIAALSLPAYAQEAAQPVPAKPAHGKPQTGKSEQPAVTAKPFGDWDLRCRENGGGTPARFCEISQTIESQDQSGPIAKISVGRPSAGAALHAVIILPNNVSFPSSVHLRTEQNDKWGLELDWQRCIPGGCFADATLSDATVAHWRSLDSTGSIVFQDAAGDEISLPMTFHGFGQALDALNKA